MKFRDKSSGGGKKNFLKLKAGESVRGVFRGDPVDFRQHWVGGRGIICKGEVNCPLCKEGDKAGFRFRLNFIMNENGAYVSKVFEQGWHVYKDLKALHEGDYDLEKHLMKITRQGSDQKTTYSIVPVPNGIITKEIEEKITSVPLQDLSLASEESSEPEGEDLPF